MVGVFFQEGRVVNLQTLFPQYKEFAGMYILDIYQAQTCSEARSGERGGGERDCPFFGYRHFS